MFHSLVYVWWLVLGPELGFHSCQLSFTLLLLLTWNQQDKSICTDLYWAVSITAVVRKVLWSKTSFSFIIEWSLLTRLFCAANPGSLQWMIQQSTTLPLITHRQTTGILEDQNLLVIVNADTVEMSADFQMTSVAQGRLGRGESELRVWELARCPPFLICDGPSGLSGQEELPGTAITTYLQTEGHE